jgi:DNA mismatch repair protein MutS
MFQQYAQLKVLNPDAILFFRMGDFYEVFYDDAELCASVLELTLTARNKGDPDAIPMAGVPHHAASSYIQRLTDAGHKVAIAEQVEDPATAKGLVRREVVRVVTPGVVWDPTQLAAESHNWLAAVARDGDGYGLAFLDASTGDLRVTELGQLALVGAELTRLEPKELITGPGVDLSRVDGLHAIVRSTLDEASWSLGEAEREIREVTGVDPATVGPSVRGAGAVAAGAALRYARDRLGGRLQNVHTIQSYRTGGYMVLDGTTRRNLELSRTLIDQKRKGSLLSLLDATATPMGARLLEEWMAYPLLDQRAVQARQAGVAELVESPAARDDLRAALKRVSDIERISARVSQGTAHARDLSLLARALSATPAAVAAAAPLRSLHEHLPADVCADVAADLALWLVDEPPISMTDGGLIREGAHAELDELTRLSLEGVGVISALEEAEKKRSGIASLKIRYNKVFGYFIEVSQANLHKVPERYLRRQTLSNCERYVTVELEEAQGRVLGADERRKQLEYELFVSLRDRVAAASARLAVLARRLAALDALSALAETAERARWCRPTITDEPVLDIRGGRHPMVEAALRDERFVPNDVRLDPDRQLVVVTGPNMSGKSTVMRQTALIVLLAQMGSFVPADQAVVGLCDRVFTRVGAADDLRRGQSTFMVEMSETATILHHATSRSLVVLDEVGRGTSTYDGLSIAWAVAEDLADRVRCRTMFATHYHELCELASDRPTVVNQSVSVSEFQGEIVFVRKLKDGGASRSYGIQCARLAGLPPAVVHRANQLLSSFEKHAPRNDRQQLSLFGAARPAAAATPEPERPDPLREILASIDPDSLTPREALEALYRVKAAAR